jgi:hypothetical protein
MVTREFDARTTVPYREYKVGSERRRRLGRYFIGREANAFTILLFGLGFLFFVVAVCTDLYPVGLGIVGWVALWVLAVPLRVYFGRWDYSDTIDHDN